jgi:hypothetical protein
VVEKVGVSALTMIRPGADTRAHSHPRGGEVMMSRKSTDVGERQKDTVCCVSRETARSALLIP